MGFHFAILEYLGGVSTIFTIFLIFTKRYLYLSSIESNFWQAHEISKLELNADLVVLSACETGYGRFESGNGMASFARAFMYAGSPALIVSLWQVNDFATSEIMKNLYNNLADGMRKDEALRQAKLQYMKEAQGFAAHPAFWSPFVMIGKTDAIVINRKGNTRGWGIGIGLVVLFGIGILCGNVNKLNNLFAIFRKL